MSRWAPDARARLERAALALFEERGYDATTVTEIADRAGLTRSTFFRQFADKREVLFGAGDRFVTLFADAIRAAPPSATTFDCLAAALESASSEFTADRRDLAPRRRAVVAANSELQERDLLKRARLASAMAQALAQRGLDSITANLAAEMGVLAFITAIARWERANNADSFSKVARATLVELQKRTFDLAKETTSKPSRTRKTRLVAE